MQLTLPPPADQAAGLRAGAGSPVGAGTPPLLVVASGKGGVGKTFLALNLALALDGPRRCALMDLDWGLGNLDVALGLAPARHLGHVLAGESTVAEALVEYEGLALLPNGCGAVRPESARPLRVRDLVASVAAARPDCRLVVADTHPGLGEATTEAIRSATATALVSTPEPTALTDTYALLKVLRQERVRGPIGLVVNQATSPRSAYETAQHLDAVARRFLGTGIPYWGAVLQDPAVSLAVHRQRPLLHHAPQGCAAQCLRAVAATVHAALEERRDRL